MEQVLDVYKRPYDERRPVVCMDESPKQLISEARESIPMAKGREKRVDYEYVRHGMVNIFMANEPLRGKRLVEITKFSKRSKTGQDLSKESQMNSTLMQIGLHWLWITSILILLNLYTKPLNPQRQNAFGTGSNLFSLPNTAAGLTWRKLNYMSSIANVSADTYQA